jgi:O-antigen/teichoic acid export membrane protein
MAVSLYTVRVVLNTLGEVDYGIYNVVAGIVGFLGVLNWALISATQRFLSFELGRNDIVQYTKVFSMMLIIFVLLSGIVLITSLIIGNWVITDFLVIPPDRIVVAKWLFAFSVVTFIIDLTGIPYMSSVVAHEKMSIYAYMSILEVTGKLVVVYLLKISVYDKLATYGFLTMLVTFLVTIGYRFYCIKKLEGCRFRLHWDSGLFRKLFAYIGWNLFGSFTNILNIQGQAVLLNFFFGPVINAAKAIADRINMVVSSLSGNFYMAVRPQIIKSYAANNNEHMFKLVYSTSKFSYYLLFIVVLPLIISMEGILKIWLGADQVTQNMVMFCNLILVYSLVNVFEQPITIMIQATGNIRKYELVIGCCTLLFLPISFLLFKMGMPPYSSLIVLISIYAVAQLFRLLIAKWQLSFSLKYYLSRVVLPVLLSSVPTILVSYYLSTFFSYSFKDIVLLSGVSFTTAAVSIYLVGITKEERSLLISYVQNKILKKIRK